MEKSRSCSSANTDYLTSIRGFACFIVIAAHILSGVPMIGKYVSGCGKIGVWLFFILSAFLLTRQWNKIDQFTAKHVIQFYVKRCFRIFPCYIVTLILAFAVGYFGDIVTVVKHVFLIEGMGHFWTIPVEFKFYLWVPLIAFILHKIKGEKKQIVFLLILGIFCEILFPYWNCPENSIMLIWYVPVFMMGMITVFVYQKFESREKNSVKYDVVIGIVMLLVLCATPYFRKIIFHIEPDSYLQNKFLYFGVAWSIVILAIQNSKYIVSYLNRSKLLLSLGNISFPLYLVHYIVLNKLKIENIAMNALAVIFISIVLAYIIHKLIEQPMIRLCKKINDRFF